VSKLANTQQNTLEIPKDLNHLPNTVAALLPLYRACIVRFDAAVHARDFDASAVVYGEAHDIVERALSLDRFRLGRKVSGFRYCFYDVAQIFDWLTRAAPGSVPLFGQRGDFVAFLSTVRVRFQTPGLAGDIGISAYKARTLGFQIRAVEWDRGFYTRTGYRSFVCSSLEVGNRTDDVQAWCMGHVRHWWNGSGGKPTKFALHRLRAASAAAAAPLPAPVEDEAEALDCSACGVDISQMDEYGECPEDGAAFCPACYAKHQDTCADCVPLAGDDFEDEGRTAIGNGYITESKQLNLF
jgi:hypothetical protein